MTATVPAPSATIVPWTLGTNRRMSRITARAAADNSAADPDVVCRWLASALHPGAELRGHRRDVEPQQVFDLRARDQHRDAIRETHHDRPRQILHRRAHARHAEDDEQDARHHGAHEEAVDAVLGHDPRHHTTKAPVGPPIWQREPPRAEIRKPVTIAQ